MGWPLWRLISPSRNQPLKPLRRELSAATCKDGLLSRLLSQGNTIAILTHCKSIGKLNPQNLSSHFSSTRASVATALPSPTHCGLKWVSAVASASSKAAASLSTCHPRVSAAHFSGFASIRQRACRRQKIFTVDPQAGFPKLVAVKLVLNGVPSALLAGVLGR